MRDYNSQVVDRAMRGGLRDALDALLVCVLQCGSAETRVTLQSTYVERRRRHSRVQHALGRVGNNTRSAGMDEDGPATCGLETALHAVEDCLGESNVIAVGDVHDDLGVGAGIPDLLQNSQRIQRCSTTLGTRTARSSWVPGMASCTPAALAKGMDASDRTSAEIRAVGYALITRGRNEPLIDLAVRARSHKLREQSSLPTYPVAPRMKIVTSFCAIEVTGERLGM